MELIRLENIRKTYHVGEVDVPVLRGVSLSVERGEMVALMGASGSGKTTLMNLLGCLDRPDSGEYWLDGVEISRLSAGQRAAVRSKKLGFVFQNFNLLSRTTALANVVMPLDYAAGAAHGHGAVRATALLDRVGLADRRRHYPSQMSGGQQQRVAIARALVNEPMLLLADEPTGNLDSRTSEEVLAMLRELNEQGLTIILVTHDPKVGQHASRIIYMRDGLIEGEETIEELQPASSGLTPDSAGGDGAEGGVAVLSARPKRGLKMQALPSASAGRTFSLVPSALRTAFSALRRNLMRAFLTALGVIIGVAAVIAMMGIGLGSKVAIQQTIASMGANNLLVQPGAAASGGVSMGGGSGISLTPQDADEIAKQCPAVSEVAPLVRSRTQVVYGARNWVPVFIYGSTDEFLAVRDWEELAEGEAFTDRNVRNGSKVCLIGQTIVRELFQGESPLGKEIRIQNVPFRVIGVLTRKGANTMGLDQDDIVLAPWTTIKFRVSSSSLANVNQSAATPQEIANQVNSLSNRYPGVGQARYTTPSPTQMANTPQPIRFANVDQILVKAASASEIPSAIDEITALLRERHRLRPDQPNDFNIRDTTESTKAFSQVSDVMSLLLLIVAFVSLLVGGIGIMNIMLVSVTERTREIGLRMAVGARGGNILKQFLIEAIVLCALGAVAGIGAGYGLAYIARQFGCPTIISWQAIVASVAVSGTVGIVFGFYPAWKASRLDPIEALRYE